MKFHNQRSFMGHEISNVNNKPLLHKKGKQWIVVAVSALVLAGFGGMVSTTTHADTTTQPATTKVAPKPATNPAKATTPASSTNNTKPANSASNTQQQAKALHINLLQNANAKKPSNLTATNTNSGNNSNNSSNKKPAVHLLSTTPSATPNIKASGTWGTAKWTLDNNGNLVISNGVISNGPFTGSYNNNDVHTVKFNGVQSYHSGIPEYSGYENLESVDYSGLSGNVNPGTTFGHGLCNNPSLQTVTFSKSFHTSDVAFYDNLFNGDTNLRVVNNFNALSTKNLQDYDYMFNNCVNLKSIDLSNFDTTQIPKSGQITYTTPSHTGSGNYQAFHNTPALSQVLLGKNTILYPDSGIAPYAIPQGTMGTSFEKLDDGQPHANLNGTRIWNLCTTGNWISDTNHKGKWYLNTNNGALLITGNLLNSNDSSDTTGNASLYQNLLKETKMNDNTTDNATAHKVTSISFSDATAPKDSWRLFDDEGYQGFTNLQSINVNGLNTQNTSDFLAMFCGLKGLTHIDNLQNLNMTSANNEEWMFADDPSLQSLDLSNAHINDDSSIFDNDSNLSELNLGPNVKLDFNADLQGKGVTNLDGVDGPVSTIEDGNAHQGTWYVYKDSGTWGHATWYLLNNGKLLLRNGSLDSNQVPQGLNNYTSNVTSIATHNVTAPSDSSNLFSQFTKANPIDLTGMDFTNANNISNMFSKNNKLAVKFNNTIDWDLYKNLNSDNSKLSSLSDKTNSASASASNADNWVKNNSNSAQSADSWVYSNSASLSNASTNASKALTSLATDQNYINWLNSSEKSLSSGASQASSNAKWIENNSASVQNITTQINSLNTKISDDNSALSNAINTKADTSSVNNDEINLSNILTNDINNLDSLDEQANSLASADEDWINANSNTAASGISNANASASASASAANANADSYALSLANNATDTANVNAGGIDNTINDNYQTVQSLSNTVNANTESLADNEDNLYQTKADKPAKKQSIKKVNGNLFYFYVIKPMWLHTGAKFTKGNRVKALTAKHGYTLPIIRIFKYNGALRFEVKINGTKYFVTGRKDFVRNAYIQPKEIKRNSSIKVLRNIREYKRASFGKKNFIRNLKRGSVLPIKRAKTIAGKQVTRLQLTNGHWITANKNLVKLI